MTQLCPPSSSSPSLVIFDCDGVLIDSEIPAGRVMSAALLRIGLPWDVEETHARFRGRAFVDCLAEIEDALGAPVPDGWTDSLRAAMLDAAHKGFPAMPYAQEAVAALAEEGRALCVASSSNPPYLAQVLGATGLLPYFDPHVFSAKMVARGKPAPDLFLHAAERMGHTPSECVVVEDSVPGIRAARAAGMRVIGYASDEYSNVAMLEREGAEVVHDLRLVPRLLSAKE